MKSTPEFNKFWKSKWKKFHYNEQCKSSIMKILDKKEGSYDILKGLQIFSDITLLDQSLVNIQMSELM